MHLGFHLSLHSRKTAKIKLSTLPPTNINDNKQNDKPVTKPESKQSK